MVRRIAPATTPLFRGQMLSMARALNRSRQPHLNAAMRDVNSRHWAKPIVDPLYDAEDYARDYADITGLDAD